MFLKSSISPWTSINTFLLKSPFDTAAITSATARIWLVRFPFAFCAQTV